MPAHELRLRDDGRRDVDGFGAGDRGWRWRQQELPNARNAGLAVAVGQQPVVADAVEARRQHVEQEATHELVGVERHGLVARRALVAVVLPAEGDAALVERDQAAVEDGHPMRVARQMSLFTER